MSQFKKLNNIEERVVSVIDADRLRACTWSVNQLTRNVDSAKRKPVVRKLVDPYKPFSGTSGHLFRISYPENLVNHTNCYAYAMCWRVRGERWQDFNPGFLGKKELTIENMSDLVRADLKTVGRRVLDYKEVIPRRLPLSKEGYWIKALYCEEKGVDSIHFMIKDPKSGRWLHKTGWDYPPKVVVKVLSYTTEREMLQKSEELKKYPQEEVKKILDIIYAGGDSGGVFPTRTILSDRDNDEYISINDYGVPNTYKTLWAMLITN